jgi:hypothetical protein
MRKRRGRDVKMGNGEIEISLYIYGIISKKGSKWRRLTNKKKSSVI